MCISIMEIVNAKDTGESHTSLSAKRCDSFLSISCNWQINNDKQFIDAVTTAPMQYAPARINCEDVASVDTCIALQPVDSNVEPCMLNIKISNRQRIARIAVVSEGNVLEIFKQFGEYETTILAEFIDEYEGNIVFLGETTIQPPTTEVGIKFIRTKNKGPPMWVYGIRLFLTDSIKEAKSSAFDYDVIQNLLSNISNDKINQRSEMAKRVFGLGDKQEIIRNYKEKFLETNSRYDDHISEMSDNEKVFPSCEDNGQSNASDCKNEVIKKNSATGYSNCGENYKKSDVDIKIHSETESIKEMKSGIFNYKDFIQTFLSNTGNGKMSQKPDMTRMFEFYDKFDNDEISEIMNNEQFYQEMLGTLTSDSDYLKCKTEIAKRSNGKDRRSYEASHEKLDSLGCKNKNIRKNSDEDCTNHEDNGKSDIDIRVYIDNKFHDMEKRLMERIDEMETNTNQKLNAILERFESRLNLQP
ncbi:uncharacterized protein LOC105193832 [Solenopsis invicta]|uniref:uncharacterized protein LOC105193832 n=1 Tax=Solenopsis invicta TaxID=13686 RepID=UPI00193D938A|nr:uncharacterized protein LOC105193832 [Solenopsis invicta]